MRHALLALLSLCMLSACDTTASLKALRTATPSADPYEAALAAGYQQYAEEKVATYDWWVSKYFADKGLMAAYGRDVAPEEPARWNVPATMQGELNEARDKLIASVAANKASNPRAAANAVVMYDHWLVLQSYGWNAPRIEETRDNFFAALGELGNPVAAAEAPQPVETTSSVLYFPFDSYDLSTSAKAALDELVKYLKDAGPVKVTINGHADRVGSDAYNMALSEKRATYVMHALETSGIPKSELQYFAFGSSDPAVPTNGPEPKNRRVQIFPRMSGLLLAITLRAKLLAVTTFLAFFFGEKLADLLHVDLLAAKLHAFAGKMSKKLNRYSRSAASRVYRGIIVACSLVVPALTLGRALDGPGEFLRVAGLLLLVALAGRGFAAASLFARWRLARSGKLMLESEDKLFGDTHGVLRHLIQKSAEGFATAVIGSGFWFAAGGFTLMLPYLVLAMAHGRYATGRQGDLPFAWAASSLYRLMDAPPRTLASLLLVVAGLCVPRTRPFAAIRTFTFDEGKWYGLVANLLNISLGGRVHHLAGEVTLPWLGKGSAKLAPEQLTRWILTLSVASLLWLILLALPSYTAAFAQ